MKKVVSLLLATLMIGVVMAGCSAMPTASSASANNAPASAASTSTASASAASTSTSITPVKLVFFSGTVELVDFWNNFFAKYNSTNKDGITVEQQYQQQATNALQVKMASGDVPDLISCSVTQDMIDNNKFVDLTDSSIWSSLSPEMKADSTDVKSNKTYCVPILESEVGLIYNKTIFTKLGLKPATTWDEFVSNLRTIKEKMPGVVPFYMGAKDGWMLGQMANFTMMSQAEQKLSYVDYQKAMQTGDLASLGWDNSATGSVTTFAADLMQLQKEGLMNSDVVTATYDNQTTAFATGKAAIIGQGLWAMSDIAKKTSDTSFIGISNYPSIVDGAKPAIGSAPDGDIYISSESKNVDAAKKVLAYIMQPENLKAISEAKNEPSPNPSVSSDWGVLKTDVASITADDNIAKLSWCASPSGFSGDDQGKMIQALLAGGYKASTDFANAWNTAWVKGVK